jgi:SAM-dependent methyltransferase
LNVKLTTLPASRYVGVNRFDPIRFYDIPVLGRLYKRRVELCLSLCRGGERVLEVGFGSGVSFFNLAAMYGEVHGLDLTADTAAVAAMFAREGTELSLRNGDVLDMPYPDETFDTVLLISILEHLKPEALAAAFTEIRRVLKPGGQAVYGVPMDSLPMRLAFRALGFHIGEHHFSTARDVRLAAERLLKPVTVTDMHSPLRFLGPVYQTGHFTREAS